MRQTRRRPSARKVASDDGKIVGFNETRNGLLTSGNQRADAHPFYDTR
jgi:hypothetical protein